VNRSEVEFLQSLRGDPAVSILMPTYRRAPENRQNSIQLKQLVSQTVDLLKTSRPNHEVEPLLGQFQKLMRQIDYRKMLDGLALFVSRDLARYFHLPFTVAERIVVDDRFAVRDLHVGLNHSPRYWVLVLSKKSTRLFEGWLDTLIPVNVHGFPMTYEETVMDKPLLIGYGIEKSKHRETRDRRFLRQVDAAMSQINKIEQLPFIVVGLERWVSVFKQITNHAAVIAGSLPGDHARASAQELSRLVAPLIQSHLAQQQQQVVEELGIAVGAGRCVSGLEAARKRANETYGAVLLIEKNGWNPRFPQSRRETPTEKDNAVSNLCAGGPSDDLIERVLARKGRTVFLDKGMLQAHQGVAMILPY
jgi:hypothetical protein